LNKNLGTEIFRSQKRSEMESNGQCGYTSIKWIIRL